MTQDRKETRKSIQFKDWTLQRFTLALVKYNIVARYKLNYIFW